MIADLAAKYAAVHLSVAGAPSAATPILEITQVLLDAASPTTATTEALIAKIHVRFLPMVNSPKLLTFAIIDCKTFGAFLVFY